MKQLIPILCVLSIVNGRTRIINGKPAGEQEFPYQAYFTPDDGRETFCGGSIIHKRWILTAAHCDFTDNNTLSTIVLVGTVNKRKGGEKYHVEKFIKHHNYRDYLYSDDIALIRVKKNIKFNEHVEPINLPKDDSNKFESNRALISGWGLVTKDPWDPYPVPHALQYIIVRITKQSQCTQSWNFYCVIYGVCVLESNICTSVIGGKEVHYGDSGGPVVVGDTQVGVVNFGADGLPNVHSRVSSYLPWIKEQMKLYNDVL